VDWNRILTDVGQAGVVVAAAGWVLRLWITTAFSDRSAKLEAQLARDLEAFKTELQAKVTAQQNEERARFERALERFRIEHAVLQARRARIVAKAYALVDRTRRSAMNVLTPFGYESDPPTEGKLQDFGKVFRELFIYFSERRVWFDSATSAKFDSFVQCANECVGEFADSHGTAMVQGLEPVDLREVRKAKRASWKRAQAELGPLQESLAVDFRTLLGVSDGL